MAEIHVTSMHGAWLQRQSSRKLTFEQDYYYEETGKTYADLHF